MNIAQEKDEYVIHVSKEELIRLYELTMGAIEEYGGAQGKDLILQSSFKDQINLHLSDEEKLSVG